MSEQVTVPLPARRQGRPGRARGTGVGPGAPGSASAPTPDRIPRVARVLALAHHWQGLIRSGAVRNQADLARLVGVSRARVTQVMDLLSLAPDLQDAVLLSQAPENCPEPVGHRYLSTIAAQPVWTTQRSAWRTFRTQGPASARVGQPPGF